MRWYVRQGRRAGFAGGEKVATRFSRLDCQANRQPDHVGRGPTCGREAWTQSTSFGQPMLANELREIIAEYNAFLTGDWAPNESERRGFFAERFAMARHYAHEAGQRCLAIALNALEEQVLE